MPNMPDELAVGLLPLSRQATHFSKDASAALICGAAGCCGAAACWGAGGAGAAAGWLAAWCAAGAVRGRRGGGGGGGGGGGVAVGWGVSLAGVRVSAVASVIIIETYSAI